MTFTEPATRPYETRIVDESTTTVCLPDGGPVIGCVRREHNWSWWAYRAVGGVPSGWRLGSYASLDVACRNVWQAWERATAQDGQAATVKPVTDTTLCGSWCTDRRCETTCVPFGTVAPVETYEQRTARESAA